MKVLKANVFAAKANLSQAQWRELRRQGIGGSDAAAIVGMNPYASAYSLFMNKTGRLPEAEDNEAMRQGRDLEEYVAQRFRERMKEKGTPKRTKECGFMLQHPQMPFLLANVDRLIVGERAGLECKTTSVLNLKKFKNGEYPQQYYPQCVHYMAVTGAERWYLGVLVLNQGFYDFVIERDEEDIAALTAAEKTFWHENVLKDIVPAPDGSERTSEAIKRVYPDSDEDFNIDLFAYKSELERLSEADEKIKLLERERDEAKQKIQAYMQTASKGIADGYEVSWRTIHKNLLDTSRLKAEKPNVYAEYLKQSSQRNFSIKRI